MSPPIIRPFSTAHFGIALAVAPSSGSKWDATGDEAAGWQLDRCVAIDERSAIAAQ